MRYDNKNYDCVVIYDDRGIIRENEYREISINNLKYNTFELIEEQQDIDIQDIKEFIIPRIAKSEEADMWTNRIRINELIRAVKQLDRKIREER